jgi:universal stress protein E
MQQIRTIVVGVAEMDDGHPATNAGREDPVLAPAAALAERLGAALHVVRVFDRSGTGNGVFEFPLHTASALQRRRSSVERNLWAQTRRFPNAARIYCNGIEGGTAIQLCGFAEELEADLLIVGATRRTGVQRNVLGSTAERVLRRSVVPVLVMRHPFRPGPLRTLLTTDLSETSSGLHERALDVVESLGGSESLELRTLLVCRYGASAAARVSLEFMKEAATGRLRQFLAERRRRSWGVPGAVRIGNPSSEILREAEEWNAELVVVGSYGGWGASRWLLGSTAAAVVLGSSGNVLVIPAALAAEDAAGDRKGRRHEAPAGFPGTEENRDRHAVLVGT